MGDALTGIFDYADSGNNLIRSVATFAQINSQIFQYIQNGADVALNDEHPFAECAVLKVGKAYL